MPIHPLKPDDPIEDFTRAVRKATKMGMDYSDNLEEINKYIEANNVQWGECAILDFLGSVKSVRDSIAGLKKATKQPKAKLTEK